MNILPMSVTEVDGTYSKGSVCVGGSVIDDDRGDTGDAFC